MIAPNITNWLYSELYCKIYLHTLQRCIRIPPDYGTYIPSSNQARPSWPSFRFTSERGCKHITSSPPWLCCCTDKPHHTHTHTLHTYYTQTYTQGLLSEPGHRYVWSTDSRHYPPSHKCAYIRSINHLKWENATHTHVDKWTLLQLTYGLH